MLARSINGQEGSCNTLGVSTADEVMEELTASRERLADESDRSHRAVLRELYEAEYAGMVRVAFALVGSNSEAEDIVQDSFVEVYQRIASIRRPGAYLRRVVISRCKSALRRRQMIAQHPPDRREHLPPEAGHLWDVLRALPVDQRIAIVLKYYGGYRSPDIASMTGMPSSTVRSHIRRGIAHLRKELER